MSGGSAILALPEIGYDEDENELKKQERLKLEKLGGFYKNADEPKEKDNDGLSYEERKAEEYGKVRKSKEDDDEDKRRKVSPPTRVLGSY